MKQSFKYLIIGTSLLIGSTDVLAHCGRSHNVVAPHHGFSFGYGGPNINRFSHRYRPQHHGSQFNFGHGYRQPFNHSYGGHSYNHRRYYNQHRYYRPRWIGPHHFRYR